MKMPTAKPSQAYPPLSVQFIPAVKVALEKAAKDDSRPVSSLVQKIVADWLKEKGYLKWADMGLQNPQGIGRKGFLFCRNMFPEECVANQSVFWTVVSGTLVYVLGQMALELVLKPVRDLKKTIGMISHSLIERESDILNPGRGQDDVMDETAREQALKGLANGIRKSADGVSAK
jgi:hypothetical protein